MENQNTKKIKYMGDSDPAYCIKGKIYEVLYEDEYFYNIIDETGEEFSYQKNLFVEIITQE